MTSLEFCHEIEFSKINFIERKVRITHPKTIVYGPAKAGKSYLIYDYLSNFKSEDFLYIDLNDLRNNKEEIATNLEEHIFRNRIKILVLENFKFDFKIPFCDSIIISTNKEYSLRGYKKLFLTPLDFEEYLLHEKKIQSITHNFNNFLKYGNLPQSININEFKIYLDLQNIIKLINPNKTSEEILKTLILNIDEKKSLNQLYLSLKSKIRISKDKFYEECKRFENEKLIYFIPKFNQKKAIKKIYSYNGAFFSAISHKKKFKNELTNIIFLELINNYKDIYYLDYLDFYIPSQKMAIISIPFFNSFLTQTLLKKIKKHLERYEITQLYIITVSNNEHFTYKNSQIYVQPFYEWALS